MPIRIHLHALAHLVSTELPWDQMQAGVLAGLTEFAPPVLRAKLTDAQTSIDFLRDRVWQTEQVSRGQGLTDEDGRIVAEQLRRAVEQAGNAARILDACEAELSDILDRGAPAAELEEYGAYAGPALYGRLAGADPLDPAALVEEGMTRVRDRLASLRPVEFASAAQALLSRWPDPPDGDEFVERLFLLADTMQADVVTVMSSDSDDHQSAHAVDTRASQVLGQLTSRLVEPMLQLQRAALSGDDEATVAAAVMLRWQLHSVATQATALAPVIKDAAGDLYARLAEHERPSGAIPDETRDAVRSRAGSWALCLRFAETAVTQVNVLIEESPRAYVEFRSQRFPAPPRLDQVRWPTGDAETALQLLSAARLLCETSPYVDGGESPTQRSQAGSN